MAEVEHHCHESIVAQRCKASTVRGLKLPQPRVETAARAVAATQDVAGAAIFIAASKAHATSAKKNQRSGP